MTYTIAITGSLLLILTLLYFFKVKKNKLTSEPIITPDDANEDLPFEEQDVIVEIDQGTTRTSENDDLEQGALNGEVISIFLVAEKDKPYAGFDLLQTLLTNGLRFGKFKIFHYLELDKPLFSLASAHNPGTFEIDKMANFSTSGLCIFMQVSGDSHLETSFEKMLQTAQVITKELGGYLLDEQRNELTDSRIQQLRMLIRRHSKPITNTEQNDNTD